MKRNRGPRVELSNAGRSNVRTRAVRAQLQLEATYRLSGFPPRPAHIAELSRTGLQLRVSEQLAIGSLVEIAFDPGVAVDPTTRRPPLVEIRGRVVRLASSEPRHFVYGVDLQTDSDTRGALGWACRLERGRPPHRNRIAAVPCRAWLYRHLRDKYLRRRGLRRRDQRPGILRIVWPARNMSLRSNIGRAFRSASY